MYGLGKCIRCGSMAVEHLKTHSHCWECSYSPEGDHEINQWHRLEFGGKARSAKIRERTERSLYETNLPSTLSHELALTSGLMR